MALGKSLCYWGRMNMYKLFHMPWVITWQAKVGIPLAISLPLAGGNSSPKNILGKLFPDDYPLKCKYIYPCFRLYLSYTLPRHNHCVLLPFIPFSQKIGTLLFFWKNVFYWKKLLCLDVRRPLPIFVSWKTRYARNIIQATTRTTEDGIRELTRILECFY